MLPFLNDSFPEKLHSFNFLTSLFWNIDCQGFTEKCPFSTTND